MNKPIQPIKTDARGVLRFQGNAIVEHLLEHGQNTGCGLNELACLEFSREDREQFAQLTSYSLSGFSDLSYVSNETYETAERIAATGESEDKARIAVLEQTLANTREAIKQAVVNLFRIHPDDLCS